MKAKSDDQRENANKSQNNINRTTQNMEAANELIGMDDQMKQALIKENERRRADLENMRKEIHEEAEHPRPTFP